MLQRLFSALFPERERLLPRPTLPTAEEGVRRYWFTRGWEFVLGEVILWSVMTVRETSYFINYLPYGLVLGGLYVLSLLLLARHYDMLWLMTLVAFLLLQGVIVNRLGAVTALSLMMPYTLAALVLEGRERFVVQSACIIVFWLSLIQEIGAFFQQIDHPNYIIVSFNILLAAYTFQTMRYLGRLAVEVNTAYIANEVQQRSQLFLARVSHELRTPLNSVLGFAKLMRHSELTTSQQSYLTQVIDEGEHLNRLVSDLLDSAHLATGKLTLNLNICDLNTICSAVIEEQHPNIRPNARLTMQLADTLPMINGDPVRLRQIIGNLVVNAVKYTPQGEISLRTYRQDRYVCAEVKDTGIGIPEAEQKLVFVPFVQLNNRQAGVGLGLDIALRLTQLHGGDIQLESIPGMGSTFTVMFPIP